MSGPYRDAAPRPSPARPLSRLRLALRSGRRELFCALGSVALCFLAMFMGLFGESIKYTIVPVLVGCAINYVLDVLWGLWIEHRRSHRIHRQWMRGHERELRIINDELERRAKARSEKARHRPHSLACKTPGGCFTLLMGQCCHGCKLRVR